MDEGAVSALQNFIQNPTNPTGSDDGVAFQDSNNSDFTGSSVAAILPGYREVLPEERPDQNWIPQSDLIDQTPKQLKIKFKPFQSLGVLWMKSQEDGRHKGGLLADDMGLGKTIQLLGLIMKNPPTGAAQTTLVVCPVGLKKMWKSSLRDHFRSTNAQRKMVVRYHHEYSGGNHPKTFAELTTSETRSGKDQTSGSKPVNVVITTYGKVLSEFKAYEEYQIPPNQQAQSGVNHIQKKSNDPIFPLFRGRFHRIILDESQYIKNFMTVTSRACCSLEGDFRWSLSATPVMNNIGEVYAQFKFLRHHKYISAAAFQADFTNAFRSKNVTRIDAACRHLRDVLDEVMLRRTKRSQLYGEPILDLPAKTYHIISCKMSNDEREFYEAITSEWKARVNAFVPFGADTKAYSHALEILTRLRQACCHPAIMREHILHKDNKVKREEIAKNIDFLTREKVSRILEQGFPDCGICKQLAEDPLLFQCGHFYHEDCFVWVWDRQTEVHGRELRTLKCPTPGCNMPLNADKCTSIRAFTSIFHSLPGDRVLTDKAVQQTLTNLQKKRWPASCKVIEAVQILTQCRDVLKEKAIVFSQFTALLDELEFFLEKANLSYTRYDGSMSPALRNGAITKWEKAKSSSTLLCSTRAASVGLNLVAASRVIIFDPTWNP